MVLPFEVPAPRAKQRLSHTERGERNWRRRKSDPVLDAMLDQACHTP